jgi:PKD repeat protein
MSSRIVRRRSRLYVVATTVTLLAGCADNADRSATQSPTAPTTVPAPAAAVTAAGNGAGDVVLVGAGNIARCDGTGDDVTAALLDGIDGTVFTLGDNAFPGGTAADFANCYANSWGRHRARTRPSVGDVDQVTAGAAAYHDYFGTSAGTPGKGYYAYDAGSWRVIVLNSGIDKSAGSTQERWLRAELAANPRPCILAYWHHPLFWSGTSGSVRETIRPLWDALYEAGADLVLNAHNRNYERFARLRPDGTVDPERGIRQIIVGTGGYDLSSAFGKAIPGSEVRSRAAFGVLALALRADGYTWEFVPQPGSSFQDSGSDSCSPAETPVNNPPTADPGGPYAAAEGSVVTFDGTRSADPDADPLTYAWTFGDGSTGSGARPAHGYANNGTYTVTLTVTDTRGESAQAVTTATIANVAPSVSAGADAAIETGESYPLAASFTDPGSQDGPWNVVVSWGDGSPDHTLAAGAPGGIAALHGYATSGSYTVRVIVTDRDGDTGSDELVVTAAPPPPPPPPSSRAVLVGAGNIARCDRLGDEATAALVDGIEGAVMVIGDNAYMHGTDAEYANCYHPTWGRHRARTYPAPGNRDYDTDAGRPYFEYFGARAGDATKGYYSYDLGDWHIIVLNSNKEFVSTASNSAQLQWLRADLAAAASRGTQCTLAYWHHPRFYQGGDTSYRNTSVLTFWNELYAAGAELVVNGHFHLYERYAPQRPDGTPDAQRGIRQFIVGTGGTGHDALLPASPNTEVRDNETWGVLKLTLEPGSYSWEFIPEAGKTFTDRGEGTCR